MKGMVTCKICGRDFALMEEEHYVAHDPKKKGALAALVDNESGCEYDAFDCPHCGCQYIAQERKLCEEQEDDEENSEFESCENCKYYEKSIGEEPCVKCIHAVIDGTEKFELREDR